MRTAFAIAAVTAGLAITTVPAAAQGWGYGGYDQPSGYEAYAYSAPGGCTCGGPPAAYGYSRTYAPGYTYAPQPGYVYAPQPGYTYSSTTYAYEPGYAYGRSYEAYAYEPGFTYGRSYGYDTYVGEPGYARRGAAVAARSELREDFGSRSVVRSGTVARERAAVRTSARDQAAVGMGVRGEGVRTGSTVRSTANIRESTPGVRARSSEMRGEATVGRGGGEPRAGVQGNAEFRGAPAARSGEPRGRAGGASESGMR
jgi:hypothetical protein